MIETGTVLVSLTNTTQRPYAPWRWCLTNVLLLLLAFIYFAYLQLFMIKCASLISHAWLHLLRFGFRPFKKVFVCSRA